MTDEVVPPPADTTVIEGGPDRRSSSLPGFKFKYGGREFNTEAELEGYLNDDQPKSLASNPRRSHRRLLPNPPGSNRNPRGRKPTPR